MSLSAFARVRFVMLRGVACSIVAACGADGVASPGEGVIVIPAPTPTPTPTPSPTPTPTSVEPADSCPSISGPNPLTDLGTISGPEGTWRNCGFPARFTATTAIPKVDGVLYRSEEHTSELQSLMRISSAVFWLKKKKYITL